jgi:hypothetical protein
MNYDLRFEPECLAGLREIRPDRRDEIVRHLIRLIESDPRERSHVAGYWNPDDHGLPPVYVYGFLASYGRYHSLFFRVEQHQLVLIDFVPRHER